MMSDDLTQTIVSVDVQIGAAFSHRTEIGDRIDLAILNLTDVTDNAEGAVCVNAPEVGLSLNLGRGVRIAFRYTCGLE